MAVKPSADSLTRCRTVLAREPSREVGVAEGEEAEAAKASGGAESEEAAVVVVGAEVADLAEVAAGGAEGPMAEGGDERPWKQHGSQTAQNQGPPAVQPHDNGRACQI